MKYINQIFCATSEKMADIPNESVDLMVTSPPYNIDIKFGNNWDKGKVKNSKGIKYEDALSEYIESQGFSVKDFFKEIRNAFSQDENSDVAVFAKIMMATCDFDVFVMLMREQARIIQNKPMQNVSYEDFQDEEEGSGGDEVEEDVDPDRLQDQDQERYQHQEVDEERYHVQEQDQRNRGNYRYDEELDEESVVIDEENSL